MLTMVIRKKFKRDMRRASRQGKDLNKINAVIETWVNEEPLEECFKDHALSGDYQGARESHIEPDWLLIYEIDKEAEVLRLVRTGTHASLFDM